MEQDNQQPTRAALIAYAAGLLEGEGYIVRTGTARLGANMTDREPLDRLCQIFGGRLLGPKPRPNPSHKPIYVWHLNGWNSVEAALQEMWPWLGPRRREQATRVLADAPPPDRRKPGWHNAIKTHCKRGHEFTPQNTYIEPSGSRICKICRRARGDRYRERHGDAVRARQREQASARYDSTVRKARYARDKAAGKIIREPWTKRRDRELRKANQSQLPI